MDIQNAARNVEKIVSAEDKEFGRRTRNQGKNLNRLIAGEDLSTFETNALLQWLADGDLLFSLSAIGRQDLVTLAVELDERGEISIPKL